MNFFKKIQNSIYSPEFYSKIPKQSFGTAFKYFLLLTLLFTAITAVLPIWSFVTVGQKEIEKLAVQAKTIYPSDLTVKIQNGKLSTNVEEPYFFQIPEDESKQNFIVIDTKTPFSTTQFNQYKTIAWVTQDSIFVKDDNQGQLRTIDLSKADNFTLNKSFIDSVIAKVTPWLKLITPIAIIAILVGLFVAHLFLLVYLLFIAVLIWLILKLLKKPLSYGESYKVGMYALTLGLIVDILMSWARFPGFPFMRITLILLVVFFNFQSSKPAAKAKK